MNDEELKAWLSLYLTPRVGVQTFARLIETRTPLSIVQSDGIAMRKLGLTNEQVSWLKCKAMGKVSECMQWLNQSDMHHIVTWGHSHYPPLLRQAKDAPPVLFVKGETMCLAEPQIAVVGSRNASSEGLHTASNFAQAIVKRGVAVTSGLALGVDGHAHNGALIGEGKTVAVLGCGLGSVYPAQHRGLAQRILAQKGALVSEFPPYIQPRASHFPRRNRIISGLSMAVLVIEAAEKSGSLITARYALEQGREVMAIPGSIHNSYARGCNRMIQQGAALVLTVDDVFNEIESLMHWTQDQSLLPADLHSDKIDEKQPLPFAKLLANVGSKAVPVDILASRTHIPVQEVMMQLLELELSGHIVAVSGGYIRKGRG